MVASGGAAAAAPAKTRRDLASTQTETASSRAHSEAEALFEKHVEIDKDHTAVATATPVVNPPTFTFGGANEPEESKKGPGKAFLVVILVALLAAALYFGWSRFGGKLSLPSSKPPQVAPETVPGPSAPARSSPLTNVSPAVPVPRRAMPAAQTAAQTEHSVPDEVVAPANAESAFEKSGHSSLAAPSKPSASVAEDQEPAVAPIVVKNGSVKAKRVNPAISDTPAPSVVGIASSGSGNLPNLIGTDASVPRPMLQTMNVSQGVSRGLLIKKVQPTYPPSALRAKTEGTVELLATISKEGEITAVKVISGDQLLSRAATDAVKLWKYKPYLLNGEPVEIQTQITINFRLPH
jgi:protein TonB